MADTPGPGDDLPPNPVRRYGSSPEPAEVAPARSARARPPRPGPGAPPREWPGPVLRRLRDPLPDGYASRLRRRRRDDPDRETVVRREATGGPTSGATVRFASGPPGGVERRRDAPVDDLPDVEPETGRSDEASLTPEAATPLQGPEPGPLSAVRRKLGKALVPGERILVAQTRHPIVLAEPVLTSLGVLLAIAAVSPSLGSLDLLRNALMLGWVVLALRALWSWLEWVNDYFVVTDRRLMRLHGIFDVQRDMMPLTKVTDMAFQKPFWGRPFGYGRFVLESAGQDQALRKIDYVRDPENVDAIIGRQIFAKPPFQTGRGR